MSRDGRWRGIIEVVGIVVLLVVAGVALMATFVCLASEGGHGMSAEDAEQAERSERTCLLIAIPVTAGALGGAFVLVRHRDKRRALTYPWRDGI